MDCVRGEGAEVCVCVTGLQGSGREQGTLAGTRKRVCVCQAPNLGVVPSQRAFSHLNEEQEGQVKSSQVQVFSTIRYA
eukprot:5135056-Prymnesium_polylepis.1